MSLKIVAYYTNDFYMEKAKELSLSLNKHWSGEYEITKVTGPETWLQAVSYKPRFILDSMLSTSCDYILYTDADSKLQSSIPMGQLHGDVAYVPFQRSPHHEEEALTGTLVFRNTMAVRALVLAWSEVTAKYQHTFTPEQYSLREVIAHSQLSIQRLPLEWCWIYDDFKELFPNGPTPIFEHYQASREYKAREAQMPNVQGKGISSGHSGNPSEWSRSTGSVK